MYRGCSVKVETMVPICWHILYGMKVLPRLSPHNAECNNVYTEDVLLLELVTCTLVPTKNKSLVLCHPIVLAPVFAIILPSLRCCWLLPQKACFILQQFYTETSYCATEHCSSSTRKYYKTSKSCLLKSSRNCIILDIN